MDIIARPIPERVQQAELLDQGLGTPEDVAVNLREMQRINDLLGGTRALTQHLYPILRKAAQAHRIVTVLDLGTGGAGLPLLLARWARQTGIALRVVGVDWAGRNLKVAAEASQGEAGVTLLQGDALHLPLADGTLDVAVSSLFLHHLGPQEVVRVLRHAYRIARCGVVMSDLVRGRLPYLGFRLIQPVLARNYLTRHDGALSVRRAYTPAELGQMAAEAGLDSARVYSHFPWRMTLVVER